MVGPGDLGKTDVAEPLRETESALVAKLRAGDESAFASLVDDLHGRLLGLARTFTPAHALAEDIVQETWLAVIRGLSGFEGRSSIRTWIFNILVRRARTMAAREGRRAERSIPLERRRNEFPEWEPGKGRLGLWEDPPVPWDLEDPDAVLQGREALEVVRRAVEDLPEAQRQVVILRDIEAVSALDVCNILEISETNQRVLLHRGRARIRRALDHHIREGRERPVRPRANPKAGIAERSPSSSMAAARSRRGS